MGCNKVDLETATISLAAALAEWDDRMRKIFKYEYNPEQGLVKVDVNVRGIMKTIVLFDFLPVSYKGTTLIYAKQSADKAFWGPFLEKAFAKVNGNYQSLKGGFMDEAFNFLTNAPSKTF